MIPASPTADCSCLAVVGAAGEEEQDRRAHARGGKNGAGRQGECGASQRGKALERTRQAQQGFRRLVARSIARSQEAGRQAKAGEEGRKQQRTLVVVVVAMVSPGRQ